MIFAPRLGLIALSALSLAACAGNVRGYPSLAPRPIEKAMSEAPAAALPPTPPVAEGLPALSGDLAKIAAAADSTHADFQAALAAQRATIEKGRNATAGSESWVAAQEAYSAVDAARAPIGTALADLDRLRQEAVAKNDDARQQAIEALTLKVQALDDAARSSMAAIQPAG
jgi:hypothetical protein